MGKGILSPFRVVSIYSDLTEKTWMNKRHYSSSFLGESTTFPEVQSRTLFSPFLRSRKQHSNSSQKRTTLAHFRSSSHFFFPLSSLPLVVNRLLIGVNPLEDSCPPLSSSSPHFLTSNLVCRELFSARHKSIPAWCWHTVFSSCAPHAQSLRQYLRLIESHQTREPPLLEQLLRLLLRKLLYFLPQYLLPNNVIQSRHVDRFILKHMVWIWWAFTFCQSNMKYSKVCCGGNDTLTESCEFSHQCSLHVSFYGYILTITFWF